ncbi:MAG TPA: hypothetical protein VGY56_12335 [Verrucomicrobiae bacterium]|nr:hypothetical protein [Verrucomicrobiae bacterium]
MNPIFQFLDWLIRAHGEALSNLFVYVGIPFIAWHLGKRAGRKKIKQSHTFVLVIRPPAQSSGVPPVIRWNFEPPDDSSSPFGA